MKLEREICDEIEEAVGSRTDLLLFRMTNGVADFGGRKTRVGTISGFFDYFGGLQIVIKPEHVGMTILQFFGIEAKKEGRDTTAKARKLSQGNLADTVNKMGGRAGIARSGNEGLMILGKYDHITEYR